MTSLERIMAAIRGEPFDKYPFVNPYPFHSMMPHWPELVGLTWLHVWCGSDEQRLACIRSLDAQIGLDMIPLVNGRCGQDKNYSIRVDDGVPVLIDLKTGEETRHEEFPWDMPVNERKYQSVAEVEAEPAPSAMDVEDDSWAFARKMMAEFGQTVCVRASLAGPFSSTFRALTFEGLFEAIVDNPSLVHAIAARTVEQNIVTANAYAQLGIPAVHVNEYPCGADLLSDDHFQTFVLPYLRKTIEAIHDAGMVAVLEFLGSVEPRLKHIATLDLDCFQTESSLKGYRNDMGEIRNALGNGVCLFSNSKILQVIEQGTEDVWRADAAEQAKGIGREKRFAICAGSPTTHATGPKRLRAYGEFMRTALAEIVPPGGV